MKRYVSPLTQHLTPENWKDKLNLAELSLDGLTDLLGDLKAMEKFGKVLGGYIKEAVLARVPECTTEYATENFAFVLNDRVRVGGLDEDKIRDEMGEVWVEDRRKPPIEYTELRMSAVTPE